jgi:DNA-binding winged helix-turn-helix (wHTH) protein/tetratricopeptide (TPR) repeat protein
MQAEQVLVFSPFQFDVMTQELWHGEQRVPLQAKTAAVLAYLLQHPQQLVSKETLLQSVWPEVHVGEEGLKVRIRELRRALGDDPHTPRFIETVHGSGYRWIAPLATTSPVASGQLSVFSTDTAGPKSSQLATDHWPLTTLLVGREAELTQLHAWFEQARSGTQQMVFVTGEPGIGKTAVVSAFLARVGTSDDCWIAQGQCVEHYGAGEAYLPVLAALDSLCRTSAREQILPLLRQHAPLWLAQLPSLLSLAEQEELQRQLAGTTAQRMLRELANVLAALTAIKPLMVVLEDLHWSDPSTVTLLAYLARWHEPLRLLVLGTYRPAEVLTQPHPLHALQQELVGHKLCQELSLQLLSEAAIEEYLQQRLSHTTWPTRLARVLYQQTEGNPLFMVAMVEELLAQGRLAAEESTGLPQRALRETTGGIPERLRQLVTVQMERLRTREQRLLEAASVAGLEFSVAEVAAALGGDDVVVETRCESLARRQQFLRPAGISEWPDGTVAARYGFSHALYQSLWQERVTAGRWRRWHYQIGLRKEAGHGAQANEIAAELALHFEQGRDYPRAVHYLRCAGENAVTKNAFHEAVDHLTKGLEVLKTLPDTPENHQQELFLLTTLGPSLTATKGLAAQEAAQAYRRAEELCQQLGDTPQLFPMLWGLGTFYMGRGEMPAAVALSQRLLKLAERVQETPLLLQAHLANGLFLFHVGRLLQSREHLERASALYNLQQHRTLALHFGYDPGGASLAYLAQLLCYLGYPTLALQKNDQALQLAREASHAHSTAYALTAATWVHIGRRDPWAAQAQAEELTRFTIEKDFPYWLTQGNILWGWAAAQQGNEEGMPRMQQHLSQWHAMATDTVKHAFLGLMADVCWKRQQAEEGLALVEEALAVVEKTGECFYEPELYRLKGELTLQQLSVASSQLSVPNPQSLPPKPKPKRVSGRR